MKTKAWLAAMFFFAALVVAACDDTGNDAVASSGTSDVVLLGPGIPPRPQPMTVRRAYTTITNQSNYDIGARGWSVPGPLVDFQIYNPNKAPILLDNNPAMVVISGLYNVSHVTITQPPSSTVPGYGTTSFGIEFQVDAKGDFEFGISISNHGPFSSDFSFVVSGKGQEQLGYTKAISGFNTYGVFVNGVANQNPEQQHSGADKAKDTVFSPNGRFGVANVSGSAVVFSTTTGSTVSVLDVGNYNLYTGPQFAWQSGPNDTQQLALLSKDSDGEARRLHTCVVSGTNSPQIAGLRQVSLVNAPSYTFALSKPTWSADGARLAFHMTRVPYWDSQSTGTLWGCVFAGGQPGAAQALVTVGTYSHWVNTRFEWAKAQATGDTLAYQNTQTQTPFSSVAVTESAGLLSGGTPVVIMNNGWAWAISPNGNRVALVQNIYSGYLLSVPTVYCFSTPSSAPVAVFPTQPSGDYYMGGGSAEWAPDSMSFAFIANYAREGTSDLYRQRLTTATGAVVMTGEPVNVTSFPDATQNVRSFEWSPEGQRLAFEVVEYDFSPGWPNSVVNQWVRIATTSGALQITDLSFRSVPYEEFWLYSEMHFNPRGDAVAWMVHPPETAYSFHLVVVPLSGSRLTVPGVEFDASGEITGFGVEKFQWLR